MGILLDALFRAVLVGVVAAIVGWISGATLDWAMGFDGEYTRAGVAIFGVIGALSGFFSAFGDDE